MSMIDEFKGQLKGGGARNNQYKIIMSRPPGIGFSDFRSTTMSFLCRATQLPGQEMTPIEVPFRGRKIYIAGDREFADPWTTTFINDTDFMIRNAVEQWLNGINDLATGLGVNRPDQYQADLWVQQRDRDDRMLKEYQFVNAWPISISSIDLNSDAADALEEFEVTWRYQHFLATGVTGTSYRSTPSFSVGVSGQISSSGSNVSIAASGSTPF